MSGHGPVRVSRAEEMIFVSLVMQPNGIIMRVSAALDVGQARELAAEISDLCAAIESEYR